MPWAWSVSSRATEDFIKTETTTDPSAGNWRDSRLSELGIVNVTAALIAAVVSAAFSWPVIDSSPWTAKAALYATLILSLVAVSIGSQQSIALARFGGQQKGLKKLQDLLKNREGSASRRQLYLWQLPVMILNISILGFLIGLLIIVWNQAANSPAWDDDMKIAFVASLAGIFGLANYLFGVIYLYN